MTTNVKRVANTAYSFWRSEAPLRMVSSNQDAAESTRVETLTEIRTSRLGGKRRSGESMPMSQEHVVLVEPEVHFTSCGRRAVQRSPVLWKGRPAAPHRTGERAVAGGVHAVAAGAEKQRTLRCASALRPSLSTVSLEAADSTSEMACARCRTTSTAQHSTVYEWPAAAHGDVENWMLMLSGLGWFASRSRCQGSFLPGRHGAGDGR